MRSVNGGPGKVADGGPAVDLQARLTRVVEEDERGPTIMGEVPDADVLAVSAEVGPRDRVFIRCPHEAGRPSAELDVRPPGLRDRRDVETVELGDEVSLERRQGVACTNPRLRRWSPLLLTCASRRLGIVMDSAIALDRCSTVVPRLRLENVLGERDGVIAVTHRTARG